MIQTLKLEKLFGYRQALRGVTLEVPGGQVVALVGPNGAGKSTLLRILATLMRPSRGRCALDGIELPEGAMEARRLIGYVGHQTLLYDDLTVRENLRFYARLYGLDGIDSQIATAAARAGVDKRLDDVTRTLSRGYQQRAALARALLHRPKIYLYDEPYTGLDQDSSSLLDTLFTEARAGGATVLFSTHDFPRGLAIADRAVILRNGKLVYDGKREEWRDAAGFGQIYAEQIQE
ncbi:MAG: heme ABC exporter ATP-binding protein CcmA [Anaerolineae bacterium]